MPYIGNVPRKVKVRMLERAFVADLAAGHLAGFICQQNRGERLCGLGGVTVIDPPQNLVGIDSSGHDDEAVVRGVTFAVIIEKVVASQLVKNITIPDDRVSVGTLRISRLK